MIVTRFGYSLSDRMVSKLDMLIDKFTRKNPKSDAVLVIECPEGGGKTTLSVACAYYVAEKTGREFNHNHIWFDAQKMIDSLKTTENQIAIWDEPALHSLSKDAMTKVVKNIERLLMMSRKKRHFLIINVAYFNRFNDYIVWQRPNGMFHLYISKEELRPTAIYIRKKNLEKLWFDWRSKKRRNYFKYADKWRGHFSDVLNPEYEHNVLSEFNLAAYEKAKDDAIAQVGTMEDKRDIRTIKKEWTIKVLIKLKELKVELSQKQLAILFECNPKSIQRFAKEIKGRTADKGQIYYNNPNNPDISDSTPPIVEQEEDNY